MTPMSIGSPADEEHDAPRLLVTWKGASVLVAIFIVTIGVGVLFNVEFHEYEKDEQVSKTNAKVVEQGLEDHLVAVEDNVHNLQNQLAAAKDKIKVQRTELAKDAEKEATMRKAAKTVHLHSLTKLSATNSDSSSKAKAKAKIPAKARVGNVSNVPSVP
eukprot:g6030.t1